MLIIIAYNFIFRNRLAATFSLSKEKSDNFTVLPLKIFDKLKKMCYSIIAFERAINAWLQKYPRGSRGSPAKGVVWDNRSTSSNLVFCAKKYCRKGYIFCSIFLSKSQTWYIIAARRISSRLSVYIITEASIPFARMIYKADALIYLRKCGII